MGKQDTRLSSNMGKQDAHLSSNMGKQDAHLSSNMGKQDAHLSSNMGKQDAHFNEAIRGRQESFAIFTQTMAKTFGSLRGMTLSPYGNFLTQN